MTSPSSLPEAFGLRGAALAYAGRTLWHDLDLQVRQGEFLAVLGPNGSGKTSLLRVLLGLQRLTAGAVEISGLPPRRGSSLIGYVPQHKGVVAHTPLRARDLVRFGVDGHRWGLRPASKDLRRKVAGALKAVGATAYADVPVGLLSGGELQRVRIAQALVTDPSLLLCDEPLLSLDPHHQRAVTDLIDGRRRSHGTAVVFVTHEINPILGLADRILYLAEGRHRIGPPEEVMTSQVLSDLYQSPIEVIHAHGRIVVLGASVRDRNSLIGVLMPFGLGLGVLFLALYKGRAANKFGILTGQIVAIDTPQMTWLIGTSAIVLAGLLLLWRPLAFASLDPDVAAARGIPVRGLSLAFMLLLGLTVAIAIQVVGALLVLTLICTPAAAAMRVTASPALVALLSTAFATLSVLGGILLALGGSIPISPYVTTISFTLYLACRALGALGTAPGTRTRRRPGDLSSASSG